MAKQTIDVNIWKRLLTIEKEFQRRNEPLSVRKLAEIFQIGKTAAEKWYWGLTHKNIIRSLRLDVPVESSGKVLVITDIHIPFHDVVALEASLAYAERQGIVGIIILGDMVDFYKLSRFLKNPKKRDVAYELEQANKFLGDLRKRFPDAFIWYKEGNHESHLERYIISEAKEIHSLIEDLLHIKMDFAKHGVRYFPEFFKYGKLWYLHGHEKPAGGDPEYITNVMFKYTLDNTIVGHFHRSQDKVFKRIDGSIFMVQALGYLAGELDYAPLNKWNQAFAIVDYAPDGTFNIDAKKILDGIIY